MKKNIMVTCLVVLALVIAASAAQTKERWLRIWAVENNPAATQCAAGKSPKDYGACIKALYEAGQVAGTHCSEVRITGAVSATVHLRQGVGYVKLTDADVARIDGMSQPMIELFVNGVPRLLFLPTQPKGRECCHDRLISLPRNRSLGVENDLHSLVRHPDYKRWKGFGIIVPAGSCQGPPSS